MNLSVLYRGHLTSCNYGCGYCPFAKRTESKARLQEDRSALQRFVSWIESQTTHRWQILITPWGEALVRSWYRNALAELSHCEHVEMVGAQTNLSCGIDWISNCQPEKLSLWVTFHPTEVQCSQFVRKVMQFRKRGVRLSVGMVGTTSAFAEIAALRRELPSDIYLWINAQQPRPRPYTSGEVEFLKSIDPHFEVTLRPQQTKGLPCRTGETSFTVDGHGDIRRCHFVGDILGNISDVDWTQSLQPRLCPNRTCHCFLGLAHFEPLGLNELFGNNLLFRNKDMLTTAGRGVYYPST